MDDPKTILEEESTRKDENQPMMDAIDDYLDGLQPGFTLVISRLEPSWCQGPLEEIMITQVSTPVDLNYLIQTWGGHKLRLKFRRPSGQWARHRDVPLYTFEPLKWGKPCRSQLQNPHIDHDNTPIQPPPTLAVPPPEKNTKMELLEMMQIMQQMRAADNRAMAELINAQRQDSQDPIKMLGSALALFAQFQAFRAPPPEQTDNDEVIGLLGKVADLFGQQQRPNNNTPKIVPPQSSTPLPAPLPESTNNNKSLHEQLSELPASQTIGTLQHAMSMMSPDKQAEVMGNLLGSIENIGGTELLLSQLENRGIIPPEEEYEDEEPETGPNKDPRGKH